MRYFGTDGVRGVANLPPITPQWFLRLGFHAACVAAEEGFEGPVVLGRDTRRSGGALSAAVAAGLSSAGYEVLDAGVVPTPAVSYLVRRRGGSLGVVLSASHNPPEDNGIKFFGPDGAKLRPALEARIEERLEEELEPVQADHTGRGMGAVRAFHAGRREYVDHMVEAFRDRLDLSGVTVGVHAANGAAFRTTPAVLRRLGATVRRVACRPDGWNINEGDTSVHAMDPGRLGRRVRSQGMAAGICHDGDADRVLLVDEQGEVLDGDDMLFLLASATEPRPARVVGTVMSNHGVVLGLRELGVELLRAPVGDRNVGAWMEERGAPFGAEPSGHVILADRYPTGDGLLSALVVLLAADFPARPLSRVRDAWTRLPQVLLNLSVGSKPPLEEVAGFPELLERVESDLEGQGRVLVRYSGTESKVRVMVEAPRPGQADESARRLADHLERTLV